MPPNRAPVDRRGFALRREVRETLDGLLSGGEWTPAQFERAITRLARHRALAVRQLLHYVVAGRVRDEITALEVLSRLTAAEDGAALARVANNRQAPEAARVACALALLGRDLPRLIQAPDVSGLLLRWQARFAAEEPNLRHPMMRLYRAATRPERVAWAVLQDSELSEADGRAAMFEMLLEVERDLELRRFLLHALTRTGAAPTRAALLRVQAKTGEERNLITGALAALAAAATGRTPSGWTAHIGFCDGAGSFSLRFDFRRPDRRPKSALFVLNLDAGVRESLALVGPVEVERYDRVSPAPRAGHGSADLPALCPAVPVEEALGLLLEVERADRRAGRTPPRDHVRARRLLDPLADVRPRRPEPPAPSAPPAEVAGSGALLDHLGYSGWFYDSGDHALDDLRLEVLRRHQLRGGLREKLIRRAGERLAGTSEPRRLLRMLRHNACVHRAAGEHDLAALALAAAAAIAAGQFAKLPLVQRMIRDSLHPGLYFFTPVPDAPERADLAGLLAGGRRPTKAQVLAVDLALILSRAVEVWLSRVPSGERPHSDQVQQSVLALSQTGARVIADWRRRRAAEGLSAFPAPLTGELRRRCRFALVRSRFPRVASDPEWRSLLDALVGATEALVTRLCLGQCRERCPDALRASGRRALRPGGFPAGAQAELFIRTWPGGFFHQPSPAERLQLAALVRSTNTVAASGRSPRSAAGTAFCCAVCAAERPLTARSRALLLPHDGGAPQAVCRRCRNRHRRDPAFRAQVIVRHGRLL